MDHYIICHLFWYFLGGKIELRVCRANFSGRTFFGDLESRKLWIMFEALDDYFQGQNLVNKVTNLSMLLHTSRYFQ